MVICEQLNSSVRLRLLPNCSASWPQTKGLIFFVGGVSLFIALIWTWMGAWLILPFAGLEVVMLATLAYRVSLDSYSQQILIISEQRIAVQWGIRHPEKQWIFDRHHCIAVIGNPRHSLAAKKLILQDERKSLAIGERLNNRDKQELIEQLQALKLTTQTTGKVQITAIDGYQL